MMTMELMSTVATAAGVVSFAAVFTLLYRSYAKSACGEVTSGARDVEMIESYVRDNQPKQRLQKKLGSIAKKICFYALMACLLPILAISVVQRASGDEVVIGDRTLMVVASGSMSERHWSNEYLEEENLTDQLKTYDLILLERVEADDLSLYDVIAFSDDRGVNLIHRIVKVETDGHFVTRGDANKADDSFRPTAEDVIGRYMGKRIPLVGSLVLFLQSLSGMVTLAALLYCSLMLEHYNNRMRRCEEGRLAELCRVLKIDPERPVIPKILRAEFVERIHCQDGVYTFENGRFLKKEEQEADKSDREEGNA